MCRRVRECVSATGERLGFFSPCAGLKRPTLRSSFCIKRPLHDNYVGFWFRLRWSATFSPKYLWDGAASLIWLQLWYDLVQLYGHTKSGKNKKNSIRWNAMIDVMMNKSKKYACLSVNVATFVFGAQFVWNHCQWSEVIRLSESGSEIRLFTRMKKIKKISSCTRLKRKWQQWSFTQRQLFTTENTTVFALWTNVWVRLTHFLHLTEMPSFLAVASRLLLLLRKVR